jgi:hypothetical protein
MLKQGEKVAVVVRGSLGSGRPLFIGGVRRFGRGFFFELEELRWPAMLENILVWTSAGEVRAARRCGFDSSCRWVVVAAEGRPVGGSNGGGDSSAAGLRLSGERGRRGSGGGGAGPAGGRAGEPVGPGAARGGEGPASDLRKPGRAQGEGARRGQLKEEE